MDDESGESMELQLSQTFDSSGASCAVRSQLELARSGEDAARAGRQQRTDDAPDRLLPRAVRRPGRHPGHRRGHLSADAQSVILASAGFNKFSLGGRNQSRRRRRRGGWGLEGVPSPMEEGAGSLSLEIFLAVGVWKVSPFPMEEGAGSPSPEFFFSIFELKMMRFGAFGV